MTMTKYVLFNLEKLNKVLEDFWDDMGLHYRITDNGELILFNYDETAQTQVLKGEIIE